MKLSLLKKQLIEKLSNTKRLIKNQNYFNNNDLKIIGVTGSKGKSTVCYLLHEYLKEKGFRSVLYSSVKIDSPISLINPNESSELSFNSEEELLDLIESVERYNADYLVLEVNENTIAKGLTKDIPFDVRVLTNLNPKHNLEMYSEEEYVNIKKSFFQNINEGCVVYGLQDYDSSLFNELLNINTLNKTTFTSNYIANVKGINPNNIDVLLTSIEGNKFSVRINNQNYTFKTNSDMKYNILNYLCVLSIIKSLHIFDYQAFNRCINLIKLPGRSETYKVNGRTIIIDLHLSSVLEELKNDEKVNNIKVVVGSVGSNFNTWNKTFNSEKRNEEKHKTRKYAMELLKDNVEYVYLTENDQAGENVLSICQELQNYLGSTPSVIITNRELAIETAIKESKKGDVILIVGRGNRRILCNSSSTMRLVKDSEVVEEVLKKIGWC